MAKFSPKGITGSGVATNMKGAGKVRGDITPLKDATGKAAARADQDLAQAVADTNGNAHANLNGGS